MHDTMCRQNDQSRTVHIYECHHDHLVRCIFAMVRAQETSLGGRFTRSSGCRSHCRGPSLVTIVESCLVTVVTVGDDQFLVTHLASDEIDHARIRDLPYPVEYPVFVGYFNNG